MNRTTAILLMTVGVALPASAAIPGYDGALGIQVAIGADEGRVLASSNLLSFTDGVGSATLETQGIWGFSQGFVTVEFEEFGDERALTIQVGSNNQFGVGFLMPGMTINGRPIIELGFAVGMSALGAFPGDPFGPVDSFAGLLETEGSITDVTGSVSEGLGLFVHGYEDDTFGARVFIGSDPPQDITARGWTTYDARIVYSIPEPTTALLLVSGVLLSRRR